VKQFVANNTSNVLFFFLLFIFFFFILFFLSIFVSCLHQHLLILCDNVADICDIFRDVEAFRTKAFLKGDDCTANRAKEFGSVLR